MSPLADRLQKLRLRIAAAAARRGRSAGDVTLLAVAKTQPAEQVLAAAALGLRVFGENRIQEAERKIPAVQERFSEKLEWHLIGGLQRNKTAARSSCATRSSRWTARARRPRSRRRAAERTADRASSCR